MQSDATDRDDGAQAHRIKSLCLMMKAPRSDSDPAYGDVAEYECARRRQRTDGQALFPAIAANRLPFQSPPRRLPPVARRIGVAGGDEEIAIHGSRAAARLSARNDQVPCRRVPSGCALAPSGDGTYLRRALCRVAASCRQLPQDMPPVFYGFMHSTAMSHEPSTGRGSTRRPPCVTGQKRSCKRISRGFIKIFGIPRRSTRQWQHRPWRQRMTAYKITHTPTVDLHMQISKRI